MAFYNLPEIFDFSQKIEDFIRELEKSYLSKGAEFKINYRWLHETVVKLQTKIESSELFTDDEAEIILPIWIIYFHNLLKSTNTNCFNAFIRDAIHEFKQLNYSFKDDLNNWNILLKQTKSEHLSFCFEDEEMETESSIKESECPSGSISTIQSYNSLFLIKCNFILDLFAPNRFQYAVFRAVFNPSLDVLDNLNLRYPYPLQFFTKNFFKMARKSIVPNEDDLKLRILPLKEAVDVKAIFEDLENYMENNVLDRSELDAKRKSARNSRKDPVRDSSMRKSKNPSARNL